MHGVFQLFQYPNCVLSYADNYSCLATLNYMLACETMLSTNDCDIFYCLHWNFKTLKYCYAKTMCLICFKLTAFNNDTLSFLNVNFLRDQLSFGVAITFTIMTNWYHSCVLWSCEYKIQLKFLQNNNFKCSNDWHLVKKLRIRHCSCAFVLHILLFYLG